MASQIGITPVTLYRWEMGSSRPSPLAVDNLQKIGFGQVSLEETNSDSVPKIGSQRERSASQAARLKAEGRKNVTSGSEKFDMLPSPFVRNGPPDQTQFYADMIDLQFSQTKIKKPILSRRLAFVEDVGGKDITALQELENPKPTAVSWSSNYGTHGWHRYVGRFPPQVVRSLLNHFGANQNSLVCDPFCGSGTTAVECRLLGIPFVGIEICPLSCMISRTKAQFPNDHKKIASLADEFQLFYTQRLADFEKAQGGLPAKHESILSRKNNHIPSFANIERWFTPDALLGVSIAVEFGMTKRGYLRELILTALSAKMRSIGNVDVDVVRAEYSKKPRENVDVCRLVTSQIKKMARDVARSVATHSDLIAPHNQIKVIEASALDANIADESVDCIVTSPPYGVEAISYLRTHLLSYRSLVAHLDHDPYDTRDKTIGSEYLTESHPDAGKDSSKLSKFCRDFFSANPPDGTKNFDTRRAAMLQFCDDMLTVGQKMAKWLKKGGKVAFIIGNKRLGNCVMPMDKIVEELFLSCGLVLQNQIRHKLKTNNSNSQVPWQERIIQEESIMIFSKERAQK
jgi:DNA modification methylase